MLTSGGQFRLRPPPDHRTILAELAELERLAGERDAALAGAPLNNLIWSAELGQKLFEYRTDTYPSRAARAYALVAIAGYDAAIACRDAKYASWAPGPLHLDPTVTPPFPTPSHPSYPSAHSCLSGAAGAVLGALFPREAGYYRALTDEIGESRIAAGIHVRSDCVAGLALGRQVADAVLARAGGAG